MGKTRQSPLLLAVGAAATTSALLLVTVAFPGRARRLLKLARAVLSQAAQVRGKILNCSTSRCFVGPDVASRFFFPSFVSSSVTRVSVTRSTHGVSLRVVSFEPGTGGRRNEFVVNNSLQRSFLREGLPMYRGTRLTTNGLRRVTTSLAIALSRRSPYALCDAWATSGLHVVFCREGPRPAALMSGSWNGQNLNQNFGNSVGQPYVKHY